MCKSHPFWIIQQWSVITAHSQDETRNGHQNANRNPEWWGDSSQLRIQIKPKSRFEFVPRDTGEFKSNQNQFDFVPRDTEKFEFLDFDLLTKISPPFRLSVCISLTISSLMFSGTGCILLGSYVQRPYFCRKIDPFTLCDQYAHSATILSCVQIHEMNE